MKIINEIRKVAWNKIRVSCSISKTKTKINKIEIKMDRKYTYEHISKILNLLIKYWKYKNNRLKFYLLF